MYFKKEKNRYFECYKKLVYAGPKHFDKLKKRWLTIVLFIPIALS